MFIIYEKGWLIVTLNYKSQVYRYIVYSLIPPELKSRYKLVILYYFINKFIL